MNAQNLQFIDDLRRSQTELEAQNQALRFSQAAAEGASERFVTLFSNVPLALMVVDEEGLVMASNAMALRLDGTLIDPFGGMADVQARVVRFVGDAAARLRDWPPSNSAHCNSGGNTSQIR